MNNTNILITLLGWEERFSLGINKTIESANPKKMILFSCREYIKWTRDKRESLEKLCKSKSIELIERKFSYHDPVETWKTIEKCLKDNVRGEEKCLVDITTMPRDTIWTSFHFLAALGACVDYIYYPPGKYCGDWLSKDSLTPRLIYKHSGIFNFSQKTALLIATGFDIERTEQLIAFFEPEISILIFQTGNRFSNEEFNINRHNYLLDGPCNIKKIEVDFYADDHGFPLIENEFLSSKGEYNWIFCSLGPKPSAVSLYEIHSKHPETALSYVPSNKYNYNYSKGIGNQLYGTLK
jgi:hypothetical protein